MKIKPKMNIGVPIAVAVASILISFAASLASQNTDRVESEVCLDCHEGQAETLAPTSHRLSGGEKLASGPVECVSCHSGAAVHIDDPSEDNIGNPKRMTAIEAREACSGCHQPHVELDNYGYDVHSELQLSCSSCHKVHGGRQELLIDTKADFCLGCHEAVASSFSRRSQHPLNQQNVTCLDCHQFSKQREQLASYDISRTCQNCHPEQSGPFPYEHAATTGYAIEGSGCMACHAPHGSENDRLLTQKGAELCIQCHVTPPGHLTLSALHSDIRSIENCYACHSDIHGSFVNHKLLDPMLSSRLGSSQDCGQCHDLTD